VKRSFALQELKDEPEALDLGGLELLWMLDVGVWNLFFVTVCHHLSPSVTDFFLKALVQ
jgi:hypothetical protein